MIRVVPTSAMRPHTLRIVFFILSTVLVMTALLAGRPVQAEAEATCGLTVEIIAAPFAVVDSNKPGVEGPKVAMLGARIVNTSGSTVQDVFANIGNGTTPGQFPATNGGRLALLDATDANHFLGDMAPGKSITAYWPVTYPATFDVSYNYTIWAANAANCSASSSNQITTQSEISATANKLQPTGGLITVSPSKVPPGGLVTLKVQGFNLGTIGQGPRPLSPEDAWLQPIGNGDFDPTCLRLVKSKVLLSSISPQPFIDRLYFSKIGAYRGSSSDYVEYTFVALRSCSTTLQPYQEAASGTQEKYNADYSTNRVSVGTGSSTDLRLKLETSVSQLDANGTVNVSTDVWSASGTVGFPENGSPVVITSDIPDGVSYQSGSATSTVPATVQYSTDNGSTWTTTEPTPVGNVTDVRWLLKQPVDTSVDTVGYTAKADADYDGSTLVFTSSGSVLNAPTLATSSDAVNGDVPATPTPDPGPEFTTSVQSGTNGGLESGPLAGDPSIFIGGIGVDEEVSAAALQQAQVLHKARLLEAMSLKPEDLLPQTGPAGTTAREAIPVDVLAFTEAPDAKAVDYVDGNDEVQAVVMAINSINGPYEHDYGVCNRFKMYTFDTIMPTLVDVSSIGIPGAYWFWHSVSTRDVTVREDTLTFHIFVDEASKTFHLDSRWIQTDYPETFDYAFDYVFNMQVWSTNQETTTALLLSILSTMQTLDDGAWSLVFHNTVQPVSPEVFIAGTSYNADNVAVALENVSDAAQDLRVEGIWRSQVDRNTDNRFSYDLVLDPGETTISLPFPGLQIVTLVITNNNGFRDQIFTGGGLWFDFANNDTAETSMSFPQCRALEEIDTTDLMLAGCVDMAGSNLTGGGQVGLGRTLNPNGRPVDVSPYNALRFWAKGDGVPMRIILESAGITDGDYYQAVFTPGTEWSQYIIPLDAFSQRGFGEAKAFTGTDVKAVIWSNVDGGSPNLTFSVDQLSFTNRGLIATEAYAPNTADTGAQAITVQAEDGAGVSAMTLHYSLDDGASFIELPMSTGDAARFSGAIPGQPLGSDVLFFVEAQHINGYVSTSPLDAPASLYRYRVDDRSDLLVDDFAGENLRNRNGGLGGLFNNPQAGGQLQIYRQDQTLTLDYNVSDAEQYAGYFTRLNGMDGAAFTTIDLLVRGAQGGEQLLVGLRDESGRESKVSVGDVMPRGITARWQWVQIPISSFDPALDRTKLTNMSLSFLNGYGATQGRIFIDEIRLSGLVSAQVVDRFDDANDQFNGQGLRYYINAPESTLTTQYVADDPQVVGGHALKIDYAVNLGGYAVWRSPMRNMAATAESTLVFWAKGGSQAILPNLYLSDGAARARVALADYMSFDATWQRVAVPLSAFASQGVDVGRLASFELVFEFASGAGSLYIDNIAVETAGPVQASRRVLHMNGLDERFVALHTTGGAWYSTSATPWLSASADSAGPSAVTIVTNSAKMAPGEYTGELLFRSEENTEERVTVYLSVSGDAAPIHSIYLPLLDR